MMSPTQWTCAQTGTTYTQEDPVILGTQVRGLHIIPHGQACALHLGCSRLGPTPPNNLLHLGVHHDPFNAGMMLTVDDGDIVVIPDEWGLGDKAYIGCEQMLAGITPEA